MISDPQAVLSRALETLDNFYGPGKYVSIEQLVLRYVLQTKDCLLMSAVVQEFVDHDKSLPQCLSDAKAKMKREWKFSEL